MSQQNNKIKKTGKNSEIKIKQSKESSLAEFVRRPLPTDKELTNFEDFVDDEVREEGRRIAIALSALHESLPEDVKEKLVVKDAVGAKVPLTLDNLVGAPGSNQTAIDFLKRYRRDLQKIEF